MRRFAVVTAAVLVILLGALTQAAVAGPGSARWAKGDAQNGKFALSLHVADGTDRVVAAVIKTEVSLDAIQSLTFWKQLLSFATGWDPVILLGIDLNDDGKYRAKDFKWQYSSPGYQANLLRNDTFVQCEAAAPPAGTDPGFVQVDVMADFACYNPAANGIGYGSHYGSLADYGAAEIDGIPVDATVRVIKVVLGGSSNFVNVSALVDVLQLNGITILNEPKNSKVSFEVVRD
jgi:hypothetical protein